MAAPERPTWATEVERLQPQLLLVDTQMRANLWTYPRTACATTVLTPQFAMMYPLLHHRIAQEIVNVKREGQHGVNYADAMQHALQLAARIPLVFGEIYKAMTEVLPGPPAYKDMFVMLVYVGEAFGVDLLDESERDHVVARHNGWRLDKSADGSTRWVCDAAPAAAF
jgi:hypothetical protein